MLRQADPARLGRFQIRERLGRGAQGEVYLAEDTRLDRRVAIKTIRLNSRDPSEQSRRVFALLEEARIENVDAERARDHIPDYRRLVPARSLALFPLMMKNKPIGLFYGDSDNAGALSFDPAELNLLKTLRNQAVLAIRQRG